MGVLFYTNMTKFNIVVYVKNGKIETKAFSREDSTASIELFEKVRSQGYESYLFNRPVATKYCKSTDATEATKAATHILEDENPSIVEKIVSKVFEKTRFDSVKQKTEDSKGSQSEAVDLQ